MNKQTRLITQHEAQSVVMSDVSDAEAEKQQEYD